MADVNKIPKGWSQSNVKFKDVELMDYQKKFLEENGITMHGVEMSFDPGSPEGDQSHWPQMPQGPVGPVGPPGPQGEPGINGPGPPSYDPEVDAQEVMQQLGQHFKIPSHPDPEVMQQMLLHEIGQQHGALAEQLKIAAKEDKEAQGSITKETIALAKVLLPKVGQPNANGDVFVKPLSPEELDSLGFASEIPNDAPMSDPLKEIAQVNEALLNAFPTKFPELPPMPGTKAAKVVGTPKSKDSEFEKLWNESANAKQGSEVLNEKLTTHRFSSKVPNMANTVKEAAKKAGKVEMVEVTTDADGNVQTRRIEDECGGMAHLLAPREYDANLVFEVVRQVINETLDDKTEQLLRKVSDTIADVVVAERTQWKTAYNAVTSDYHKFKTEAESWSKKIALEMAEMSAKFTELTTQLESAREKAVQLEQENKKLRVKGSLGKSPRKVRTIAD